MQSLKATGSYLFGFSLLLAAAGCSGGGTSSGTVTGTGSGPPTPSIYVKQDSGGFGTPISSSILQFSKTANGSVSPISTITGPGQVMFGGMALDAAGNLYVGGVSDTNASTPGVVEILVYPPGATGRATPTRTITGGNTGLELPANYTIPGLEVDGSGNIYVVASVVVGSGSANRGYQGISVFAPAASGDAAPTKVIAGSATTIFNSGQMAIDAAGNLYVANGGPLGPNSILIFNSSATGNVPPTGILGGTNTTIYYAQGVAVDSAGNIYVASLAQNQTQNGAGLGGTPSILEFSAGSSGNVAPTRTISGSATTMGMLGNLRVDTAGNIYILSQSQTGPADNILKFAPNATGNVAPAATISSNTFYELGSSIAVN